LASSPHGQGLKTILAQLTAAEIGSRSRQDPASSAGPTDLAQYRWSIFASRSITGRGKRQQRSMVEIRTIERKSALFG
jgi:aerobic carbon-monoxide dehydrogenase large subunit